MRPRRLPINGNISSGWWRPSIRSLVRALKSDGTKRRKDCRSPVRCDDPLPAGAIRLPHRCRVQGLRKGSSRRESGGLRHESGRRPSALRRDGQHLTESSDIDLSSMFGARWAGTTDALHIQRVELEYADGERKPLPEESHAFMYYANHVLIQSEAEQGTLSDLVQHHQPEFLGAEVDAYNDHLTPCPPGTRVVGPADEEVPLKPLASVHVRAGMPKAHVLTCPVMFDPYLLVPDVKVRNVATGEEKTFSQHGLSLGFNTAFAEGTFYEAVASDVLLL